MYSFEIDRLVAAPTDVVWAVISDFDSYATHAPNLKSVGVVSGQGVGMVRRCVDARDATWQETCVTWDEGQRYAFEVDMSNYPYPMTYMKGTWGVEGAEGGSRIVMRFEYQPKFDPPVLGALLNSLNVRPNFQRVAVALLDNWQAEIEKRVSNAA